MSAPRTTTLRTLLRFGATLLVLTIVTGGFTWAAFNRAYDGADVAYAKTVPAILEVTAARKALSAADQAAINSFTTGEARLSGPGEEYQNQIAIASQNLTQAAEDNMAGEAGSRSLRLVQGLLVSYARSIEQAAALYRDDQTPALWLADLWNASRLLHAEPATAGGKLVDPGGLLAQLDGLREQQFQALDAQLTPGKKMWRTVSWLAPATVLFGLLIVTQVFLARRFRRVVNLGLFPATLCLLGLMGVAYLTVVVDSRLTQVRTDVDRVSTDWARAADAIDTAGQGALASLMKSWCADECGYTATEFIKRHSNSAGSPHEGSTVQAADEATVIYRDLDDVRQYGDFALLIPLGALLVGVPAAAGLYFHIDQYRYRLR